MCTHPSGSGGLNILSFPDMKSLEAQRLNEQLSKVVNGNKNRDSPFKSLVNCDLVDIFATSCWLVGLSFLFC